MSVSASNIFVQDVGGRHKGIKEASRIQCEFLTCWTYKKSDQNFAKGCFLCFLQFLKKNARPGIVFPFESTIKSIKGK